MKSHYSELKIEYNNWNQNRIDNDDDKVNQN